MVTQFMNYGQQSVRAAYGQQRVGQRTGAGQAVEDIARQPQAERLYQR